MSVDAASRSDVLLSVDGLTVDLPGRTGGRVRVLEDVSFEVPRGRVVGIVGESGSGKTMLLRSLLDLLPGRSTRGQRITPYDRAPDRSVRQQAYRGIWVQ